MPVGHAATLCGPAHTLDRAAPTCYGTENHSKSHFSPLSNMTTCHFQNFDITVRGGAAPYSLTAQYHHQSAEGAFPADVFQETWQSYVSKMEDTIFIPDEELLVHAGSELFNYVMQDAVRDLWIEARADLDQHRLYGLRLRLALHPPAVAALPWEALYDPDRNQAFAANGRTPVVRVENLHVVLKHTQCKLSHRFPRVCRNRRKGEASPTTRHAKFPQTRKRRHLHHLHVIKSDITN